MTVSPGPLSAPTPRPFGLVNWIGVGALFWRGLSRILKDYRDTLLGMAASSLLFLAVFHFAFGADGAEMAGLPMLRFLAPGLIAAAICQQAFDAGSIMLVFDKMEGIFADVLMAPLTTAERGGAMVLAATAGALLSGATVLAAFLPFVPLAPVAPAALLFFAAAGALMHGLLGTLVGLWARRWDHYQAAATFVVMPLAYLSGAFYSIESLPPIGQWLVRFNPVFYVIDGVRYGFTGQAEGSGAVGAVFLLAVNAALWFALHRLLGRGWRTKS